MLMLAASPIYWRFLNPKYAWLTLAAGGIIALLALAVLLDRSRKVRASEAAGLAVFIFLAGTAVTLPNPFYDAPPSGLSGNEYSERTTPPFDDAQGATDSKIVLDDIAFTKINVAELLAAEQDQRARPGDAFVVQDQVTRTPELEAAGFISPVHCVLFRRRRRRRLSGGCRRSAPVRPVFVGACGRNARPGQRFTGQHSSFRYRSTFGCGRRYVRP